MGLLSGLGGILGGVTGLIGASKNKKAAKKYAEQTKWSPTSINMPGLGVSFDAQGNPIGQVTDTANQEASQGLYGFGSQMLGQAGQNSPFLGREFNMANMGMTQGPQMGDIYGGLNGYQMGNDAIMGSLLGQTQGINGMSGMLGQAGMGALSSLGSFDPQQLAQSYTNNLRAQAAPGEQNAAQRLAQNLFNTGRLGSTGGAGMMGKLASELENADISRTIAGQQLAGQEQSRIAGMGQDLMGSAGNLQGLLSQILGQAGGMGQQGMMNLMNIQNQAYNQNSSTTNQRFTNAMNMFGANQNATSQNISGGLNAMNLGNQIGNTDISNLMAMMGLSGNLSQARSATNSQAYGPQLKAQQAQNQAGVDFASGIFKMIPGL